MELHAYLPGVLPEKDLLLTRSGARLALIRVRANGLVFAFDISTPVGSIQNSKLTRNWKT